MRLGRNPLASFKTYLVQDRGRGHAAYLAKARELFGAPTTIATFGIALRRAILRPSRIEGQ